MKKIRQIILFVFCIALGFALNAQRQYRLQAVNITLPKGTSYTAEFMMPPYSRLGKKNQRSINYNPKFKYHRVLIKGLGDGYFANLKSLDDATYEWDNKAIPRERLDGHYEIKDTDKIDAEGDGSVIIYYNSKDFSSVVIEVDYSILFTKPSEQELTDKFDNLHANVLVKLSELENNAARNAWAKTTAAQINKKLNELLPEPHKSVMGRFGSKRSGAHSFLMLSPDMKLKVDAVDKITEGPRWSNRVNGTVDISILRSDAGLVVQSPFLQFSAGTMPFNNISSPVKDKILLASTADIQLSEGTKNFRYILLYQEQFKTNNSINDTGPTSCPALANSDIIQCNAFLVHTNALGVVYPLLDDGSIDNNTTVVKSAFGTRNLITAHITVKVNGQDEDAMLTTTLAQFADKYSLPRKYEFMRLYNGRYYPVKYKDFNPNQSPLILPGDIIIYKP
jgi:hypothetical protein